MQNLVRTTLLTLALGVSGAAFSQTPDQATPPPATPQTAPAATPQRVPNPKRQAKELEKRLSLTPDQTAQIEPILADHDQKVEALAANTGLDPKSRRQQRRAIMLDTEQKLNAILTPAQQQEYEALKAKRQEAASSIM